MVKPQSSKLITRVRFPSSPPLQRLRRKRRGLFRCWDDGNRLRLKVPKAFETFRLQPVIPSRANLWESPPHADLFPRALGIRMLQLVIPSTNPAQGCRESLPGENTFPRALGIFALQPVIPSRTSLRESLTHADLFPRALGIFALQPVIPSTDSFRTLGNRLRRNPRPHPPFCWAFSGKTGKLGH